MAKWFGKGAMRAVVMAGAVAFAAAGVWAQDAASPPADTSKRVEVAPGKADAKAAEGKQVNADGAASMKNRFIRVVEDDVARMLTLEMAIHTYRRAGAAPGPELIMAGAVHVGDKAFYETLQKELDSRDVVLFEGVKPPGVGRSEHGLKDATDEQRATATRQRIRLLATLIETAKRKGGSYPATLDDLETTADKRIGWLVKSARVDGWGHTLVYTLLDGKFDLTSLGSDAKEGGEGPAADQKFSKQKPLSKDEVGGGEGIQEQLAKSMGLVFQLNVMDHNKPNWRNSDLSVDQVSERLEKAGADPSQLFQMLGGDSMMSKMIGGLLGLIGSSPTLSSMMKMMMVEILSRADELMVAMPGDMGTVMEVIIKDRNAVVVDDLKEIIEKEPAIKTVGIIYGAGHLPDMERRLGAIGYEPAGERWIPAIKVDLAETGMTPAQIKQMRKSLDRSLKQQVEMFKRQQDRKTKQRD